MAKITLRRQEYKSNLEDWVRYDWANGEIAHHTGQPLKEVTSQHDEDKLITKLTNMILDTTKNLDNVSTERIMGAKSFKLVTVEV